jgi:glycosyltransferase involved in cell wall biosynthesis
VERKALIATYRDADVLFLHLNDLDAFEKVLPSKIFEYAALGKPIWAGVRGHAADFLTREVENAAVFPPCDVEAAVAALDRLRLAATPRAAFVAKYSREAICRQMAAEILATGQPRPSSLAQRST